MIFQDRNRTKEWLINVFEGDETTSVLINQHDEVWVHVYRDSVDSPLLSIASHTPTDNGSTVTFTPGTQKIFLKIAQADTLLLEPGAYNLEIIVMDRDDEVNGVVAAKQVGTVVYFLHPGSAGSIAADDEESSLSVSLSSVSSLSSSVSASSASSQSASSASSVSSSSSSSMSESSVSSQSVSESSASESSSSSSLSSLSSASMSDSSASSQSESSISVSLSSSSSSGNFPLAITIGPPYSAEATISEPSDPVAELTFTDNFLPDLATRLAIPEASADLDLAYNSGAGDWPARVIYAIAYSTGIDAIKTEWLAKSADFGNADWGYVDIVDSDDRERWSQFLTFLWIPWGSDFSEAFAYVKAWIDTKTASNEQDDLLRYWDNDVHGRTYHILETFLVMKTLANEPANAWALGRLAKLGVRAADELYSPYKIAGMLNGFAQDTGGIQQTGKHYDAGTGDGYERMWTTNPWMLMNLWEHCTGVDLLSQCTFFTKLGESLYYRHKNYWLDSPLARRGWYYAEQHCDSLGEWMIADHRYVVHNPEINFLYKDYSRTSALPSTLTGQCYNLSHRRGDGMIAFREDLDNRDTYMIDITWPGRGGQRSEFAPRLFGFTIGNKGLPFVHLFKGNASWRSTSGVSFDTWPMRRQSLYASYENESDRPLSQSDQATNPLHVYPQPSFSDLANYVEFTDDWSFRVTDETKEPLGEPNAILQTTYRIHKNSRRLDLIDSFTFEAARPCVYSFTLSGLPTFLSANSFEIQGANVIVEISGGGFSFTTLTDIWTGNRDNWPDDAVYDPYNLDVIVCQVLATAAAATSHSYTVTVREK